VKDYLFNFIHVHYFAHGAKIAEMPLRHQMIYSVSQKSSPLKLTVGSWTVLCGSANCGT